MGIRSCTGIPLRYDTAENQVRGRIPIPAFRCMRACGRILSAQNYAAGHNSLLGFYFCYDLNI